jgi:uncharacterized protein YjiK
VRKVELKILLGAAIFLLALIACNPSSSTSPEPLEWELDQQFELSFPEPSGLTCDRDDRVLWSVSDRTGLIYKLSLSGELLATLPWEGIDPEGITLCTEDSYLYIVEEESGEIVTVDTLGNELNRTLLTSVGATTGNGLEGIAYNSAAQSLLALREKNPSTWVFLDLDGEEQARRIVDFADDYSGATYAEDGSLLWVISDESQRIYLVSETGDVHESFETGVKKAEGIAVLNDTLYVVSDSKAELYRFVKK